MDVDQVGYGNYTYNMQAQMETKDRINKYFSDKRYVIDLTYDNVTDEIFYYLITKDTEKVKEIVLDGNLISEKSLLNMRSVKWSRLTRIYLDKNRVKDAGCKYLTQLDMPLIEMLSLSSNHISSLGVGYCAKGEWKFLNLFNLSYNRPCNNIISTIRKAKWSKTLKYVHCGNEIGNQQLYYLLLCDLPLVSCLSLKNNSFDDFEGQKAKIKLQQKLTNAKYIWL